MKPRKPGRGRREADDPEKQRLKEQSQDLARTLQMVEEARTNLADQYDYAPIGFLTLDDKGCVREVNLTATRMLGRKRDQMLGMPFLTQVAKGEWKDFMHHMSECRRKDKTIVSELTLRTRDRRLLQVELRSVPVLDVHRDGIVYRTTMIEIGDRLRIARALQESEQRHRSMVESSPDGIFIQADGVIVFANRVALRLCGVDDAEEVIGKEMISLIRPAHRQTARFVLSGIASLAETSPVEVRIGHSDKTAVDVELIARDFRFEGEAAVLVVARDISRRINAERHVLAISERERTSFGRDLHDSLCQSLTGAACLAEALRNRLRKGGSRDAAEAEEIVAVLRGCIDEARNMSRGLCPVVMEQDGLVSALHELAAKTASLGRTECLLQCDETLTIGDPGKATHLYRIAQEAVTNALKHGKARSILIRLMVNAGQLHLQIRDDGRGLPLKSKTSGMGLHTMRYRASVMGGSLEVRREKPRGTLIVCSLPQNGTLS